MIEPRTLPEPAQQAIDRLLQPVFWKTAALSYLGCNRAFATQAGFADAAAVVGKTDFDMPWRLHGDRHQQEDRAVLATGRPVVEVDSFVPDAQGRGRWMRTSKFPLFDEGGEIAGVIGFSEESTVARSLDEAKRGSKARLQTMLDTIPFPFFAKGPDLRYTGCNQAFESFIGLPRAAIVGHTVWDVSTADHAAVYDRADRALLASGKKQAYETRVSGADGVDRDVIFHKDVITDDAGQSAGIVGIYVDITEHKRVEAAHRKLEDQVRQTQNLESVGRLAGGIAHDLNNLLSPILGYADIVLEDLPAGSPHAEDIQQIRIAALSARDLIGRLMVFARKHVLEPKRCDLGGVVARVEKMLRGALREDIRLELSLPAVPAMVHADAVELERVIVNLSVNAQDAMKQGGLLRIAVSAADGAPPGDAPGPRQVLLEVSDTGCGMDAKTREHLFEPFFTTKPVGQGTGLGLATVYAAVQQHGGRITFESEPGVGTTFRIHLPMDESADQPESPERPDRSAERGTETILLVEDDDSVRRMLHKVLERHGYRVIVAGSGERAMELARESGAIDLLITDVIMPGMNGKELHSRLIAARAGLKVIFMSGHDRNLVAERGVVEDAVQFLRKPIEPHLLTRMVARLFGR